MWRRITCRSCSLLLPPVLLPRPATLLPIMCGPPRRTTYRPKNTVTRTPATAEAAARPQEGRRNRYLNANDDYLKTRRVKSALPSWKTQRSVIELRPTVFTTSQHHSLLNTSINKLCREKHTTSLNFQDEKKKYKSLSLGTKKCFSRAEAGHSSHRPQELRRRHTRGHSPVGSQASAEADVTEALETGARRNMWGFRRHRPPSQVHSAPVRGWMLPQECRTKPILRNFNFRILVKSRAVVLRWSRVRSGPRTMEWVSVRIQTAASSPIFRNLSTCLSPPPPQATTTPTPTRGHQPLRATFIVPYIAAKCFSVILSR